MEDNTNGSIRWYILITLCLQNASHALLARYSQGVLKETYSSTEVVLVAEILKLIASGYLATTDKSETDAIGSGFTKLRWLTVHFSRKILVLVFLYSVANLMSYYALARVDASVYTVLLQLKILTTAAFAVVILDRNITAAKWRSLLLLVIGCVLVASPAFNRPVDCSDGVVASTTRFLTSAIANTKELAVDSADDTNEVSMYETILGVGAVLAMVTISGYSAIYFEGMLKKSGEKITIWERNFQLALCSTVLLVLIATYEEVASGVSMQSYVFFKGWTVHTVLIALIQAAGGLLVAATLKYADAVLKTLATSGSIVLSAIVGYLLLDGALDVFVSLGCVATILAIFNYTLDSTPSVAVSPTDATGTSLSDEENK